MRFVGGEEGVPLGFLLLAFFDCLTPVGDGFFGQVEALVFGETEEFLGGLDGVCAESLAVHLIGAGLGAAVADDGANADEGRLGGFGFGFLNGGFDGGQIVAIVNPQDLPAVSFESIVGVLGEAELGRAVEGDEVVIVEEDELAEAQGPGERSCFVGDAFHHVSVTADAEGMVVHDLEARLVVDGGEVLFGDSEADGHGKSLAEGAGGDFDAVGEMGFGMARGQGVVLAEALEIVEAQFIAREKKHPVNERGGVSVGEDEAVTVRPFGVRRVVLHHIVKEGVGDGRAA